MYDSIIIGAGIAGSVIARELAEKGNRKVLVLEQREHIAGNCYDEEDENGILIHKYGPHIFHTDKENVFEYLSKFTEWNLFDHEVVANISGTLVPVPFNLNTLHLVYNKESAKDLEEKLIREFGKDSKVPILKLMNHEDEQIQDIANYVYNNIFLKYTMKQWGQKPEEIDPSVTERVPVVISRDNRYFQEKYQGMPLEGYTPMFQKMLEHENIDLYLGTDAKEHIELIEDQVFYNGKKFDGEIIYTGAIDELFDCEFGRLPYRSLRFEFENLKQKDYQGHSVVNYTVSEEFTRITEFKHLTGQEADTTTIVKEYPFAYTGEAEQIPYYAILNDENLGKYNAYVSKVASLENFYLLGRLAEYKYYNIDAMVERALNISDEILNNRGN